MFNKDKKIQHPNYKVFKNGAQKAETKVWDPIDYFGFMVQLQ